MGNEVKFNAFNFLSNIILSFLIELKCVQFTFCRYISDFQPWRNSVGKPETGTSFEPTSTQHGAVDEGAGGGFAFEICCMNTGDWKRANSAPSPILLDPYR